MYKNVTTGNWWTSSFSFLNIFLTKVLVTHQKSIFQIFYDNQLAYFILLKNLFPIHIYHRAPSWQPSWHQNRIFRNWTNKIKIWWKFLWKVDNKTFLSHFTYSLDAPIYIRITWGDSFFEILSTPALYISSYMVTHRYISSHMHVPI